MKKLNVTALMLICMVTLLVSCNSGTEQTIESGTPETKNVIESMDLGEHTHYSAQCISGDRFIGIRYVYGQGLDGQTMISYDLNTGDNETLMEFDPLKYRVDPPAVSGDLLIWSQADVTGKEPETIRQSDLNYDIYAYDLKTKKTRQITNDERVQRMALIAGDWVIWTESGNIYAHNLDTEEEKRITAYPTAEGYSNLAVSGDLVVWSDHRYGDPAVKSRPGNIADYNNEIFAYNLKTGEEQRITNYEGNDHYPAVQGNRITWLRQITFREGDIMVYDLETGKETKVSSSGYADYTPSVYGDRVVWMDAALSNGNTNNDVIENGIPGGANIYGYDFSSGKESLMIPSEIKWGSENRTVRRVLQGPVLSENYLVYTWGRQIGSIVYAQRLDSIQEKPVPESFEMPFPEPPDLEFAQPYRIIGERGLGIGDFDRSVGRWLITSEIAVSFEERAQTAAKAAIDLYSRYGRDFTSVALIAGEDLEHLEYASASFSADCMGAEGMTGSAPAKYFYWKVRATDYIYSETEKEISRLWWENMDRFPQTDMLSSCSYDREALAQFVADSLGIATEEVIVSESEMTEYDMERLFLRWTIEAAGHHTSMEAPGITVLPEPGHVLSNDENQTGVILGNVSVEQGVCDRDYYLSHVESPLQKGDPCLIVTGNVTNLDMDNFEIALWAHGFNEAGEQVSYTLDAAHIPGQIGMHLERNESVTFILHLNPDENLKVVRIFGAAYPVTPP
ncbi:MAG: hypothetical protein JW712_04950 [Dehalococcoidales bacterium]|nr:hypothetical protein [Dehalococcoidales bacterium]